MSEQPPWNPYEQQDLNPWQGEPPYQGQPVYPPQRGYGQQPPYPGQPPQQPPLQGESPYGPPGWQFPYPGYGPPVPPPRRKRHLVRNILAGIGALFVAVIAIGALASHGTGVPTTPSGSSATDSTASPPATQKAAAARVGSYFEVSDDRDDTYRVTLVKVIDPARGADEITTADIGKRFVGAVFRIKALKGSPQDEDANNDAVILGGNGQSYTADFDGIAGYTNFASGAIHVAQGETVTGAVTFQVPNGVEVDEVQWGASSNFGSVVHWNARRLLP